MIDVHVLTHSKTRFDWLEQCVESLRHEPFVVHVLRGVEGNILAGRAAGFALGKCRYVSFVDSDDFVFPGVGEALLRILEKAPAACSKEVQLIDGRFGRQYNGHHMLAFDRRLITENWLASIKHSPGLHCSRAIRQICRPIDVDFLGYAWRMHDDQSHRLRQYRRNRVPR